MGILSSFLSEAFRGYVNGGGWEVERKVAQLAYVDPAAEIEIVSGHDDHVMVRIPLAPGLSGPWTRRYLTLARVQKVPAEVLETPERSVLVVEMSTGTERDEIFRTLEAARDLIGEAMRTDVKRDLSDTMIEEHVREWWNRQRR